MVGKFNHGLILRILGSLLLFESLFLLSAVFVSLFYSEGIASVFLFSAGISIFIGSLFVYLGRKADTVVGKREGSVIVTSIWILFSLVGMLPYIFSGSIPSITNAFFETMSGFTTTGASILNDIESHPNSILYWRSLTQWIGGLGIIVISLALLPIFGFSGAQLFSAEATGPTKDKIHPKMSETAKRLLAIYVGLTALEIVLLKIAGMGWFDSLNHAFTTMATGGFSTKQASVGYWDSAFIHYIIIFFMFAAGVNFTLFYFLFKRKWDKFSQNNEFRFYLTVVILFTILISITIIPFDSSSTISVIELNVRKALFMVSSTITTTGYATADYMTMQPVVWIIIIVLMLMGASAGSTAGGIKLVRVFLIVKYAYYEFKRMIHPNAVFPVKYNQHLVRDEIITKVLSFVMLYLLIILFGALILSFSGMGFMESLSGVITCISDVGPGLGSIGPAYSFSELPDFSKWFLSFIMLVGRLEIFTVLLIFTPLFWKR